VTALTIPATTTQVELAQYLDEGKKATLKNFAVVEKPLSPPAKGQVLVRNQYLQLSAVMQDLMHENAQFPMPTYHPGQPLWGMSIGTVVASESDALAPGDLVSNMNGWTTWAVGPAEQYWKVEESMYPDTSYFLGQGPTAYHGIVDVAGVKDGDVVFVTGAAGGVGSLAGQIAKHVGAAKVIGSAGSPEKIKWLTEELGFDAAFNYHDGDVEGQLRKHAPDGIDVLFDTVGGEQFEAAVQVAAHGATFALCGALSGQVGRSTSGAFPRLDIMKSINSEIVFKPFTTMHTPDQIWAWNEHFAQWVAKGSFVFPASIVEGGLPAAPKALLDSLAGKYRGAVLVDLGAN
jgi:NADPH-dependent curcumin reductase CurA